MSQYDLTNLIKRWAQESVTVEQTIGQILLHLEEVLERIKKLEQGINGRQAPETDGAPE